MNNLLKYLSFALIIIVVTYFSIDIRPLDEKLAEDNKVEFDAYSYVNSIWPELNATFGNGIEIQELLNQLTEDPELTFEENSNAIGIGNIGYFQVKGNGKAVDILENQVLLSIGEIIVEIETEFIFGNAVRDASGLIKANDFEKTSEFNGISESINDKLRKEVIPEFKNKIRIGDNVVFTGAIALNKAHLNLDIPEIIPVSLEIKR